MQFFLVFFAEIRKEDGDEYEPDSGKENARLKKLSSSFGHFVYDFHRSMQYFHPVASFAKLHCFIKFFCSCNVILTITVGFFRSGH